MKRFTLILMFSLGLIFRLQAQEDSGFEWFLNWLREEFNYEHENYNSSPLYENSELIKKIDLEGSWSFSIGDNLNWATTTYNDQHWEKIKVPSKWENQGFNGYDGIAWYRIRFDGRKLNQKQTHFLLLGQIDDADECYVNGRMVGKSGRFAPDFKTAYTAHRNYLIPNENINFNGENIIAVRVYDQTLDGGIVGNAPGLYASLNSENLEQDLSGPWRFQKWDDKESLEVNHDDSGWDEIWVPAKWDDQGFRTFDGIAWYRKHFKVNFTYDPNKQYYLILGKIDDFDITYLNGKRLGMTNDGLRFGESTSFDKLRLYRIPPSLIDKNGDNVIAVRVKDIGYHGGIYKGPIGIVTEDQISGLK
ncbi:beta galactosidase jelly roll domain-containing protein [Reichenbachiella ulvae]|uniref:Beta galactosidase jelly roll domain-containing protein n=1 Tax=Reichenbachiella ulvae TaxID=2980104 RepID=A0ABT3CPF0_9BACT|nr:beta galactosidase jelly roll domain-containing protein [Reichenbachiella ulvae]MCV9385344.1 beta galactosidase jelly roll domain-containing protein [Reichenbachiella ulvae]